MFRGTGKMPKYADALFHLLAHLKRMDPCLRYDPLFCSYYCNAYFIFVRNAFLKNWLANLSGKVNGFKEMDLLQEHQNFWAKVRFLLPCHSQPSAKKLPSIHELMNQDSCMPT